VCHAYARESILATKLSFEHCWHRGEAVPGTRELAQHCIVLELAEQERAHALPIEPLIQSAPYCGVISR
jgi:hypothetical protein